MTAPPPRARAGWSARPRPTARVPGAVGRAAPRRPSASGPSRSARRATDARWTPTAGSGSARSPRRSPPCWSCSAATTACSTSTTRSAQHLDVPAHGDAHHPPAAVAHRRPAARAVRRRVGHPDRPGRRRRCSPTWPGPSGCCPPARRFHYSNLARRAARAAGRPAARRHLGRGARRPDPAPAGPGRDHRRPRRPTAATGYLVDAYSDHARPEPQTRLRRRSARPRSCGAPPPTWPAGRRSWPTRDRRPGRRGAGRGHRRRDALAADHHRRDAVGGRLRPRPDPVPAGRRGSCTSGHDGAMPGFLAARLRPARRRRQPRRAGLRGARLLRHRRSTISELPHELLAAGRRATTRPTSSRGRPGGRRRRAVPRRCSGRWWGEGFEYVFCWHDGALQARGAGRPGRAGRRRSSRRCRTSRTCCARSPAGRPASCCG